ncbi:hypothetical protein [Roseomonas sp. HF4]|nr:hypothetical protein [Roseomonas sp. HF4]
MKPNLVWFLAGLVVAAAIGGGIWLMQDRRQDGVDISITGSGVRIERR